MPRIRATSLRRLVGAVLLALGLGAAPPVTAQDLPNRPIAVIVTWPAGGSTDVFARLLVQRMAADTGRNFVIENRSGASGTIGLAAGARARPDGTTLIISSNSAYAIAPHAMQLPYDNDTAFAGVGLLVSSPVVLVVGREAPYRTLADYLAAARQASSPLVYAHSGIGATSHLAVEMLMQMAGIELEAVVYRGSGAAIQAVMTGQPTLVAPASAAVLPLIRAGEMRALAATTRQRSPLLAEVPTLHELGFTGFEVVEHVSLLAPAGTPAPLLQRYNAIAAAALRAPEMQPRWEALALAVEARPAEAWPDYFRGENDKWRAVLRSRGIRMP